MNYFVTFKLNTLIFNHINDFNDFYQNSENSNDLKNLESHQQRLDKQFEIIKLILHQNNDSQAHVAISSRKHELAYLRHAVKQILPFLLPESISKSRLSLDLVEEIAVSNLLLTGLDIIAEPDSINKVLIKVIESHNVNEDVINTGDRANVQILKHWCQMNGRIFKSV